jgi:large conductance mechanosensitive channel
MEIKARDTALRGMSAARNVGKEFREFLLKTNMLSLALGVVIGGAAGKVVSAIVEKLIMPFVNLLTPKNLSWQSWSPGFSDARFGVGVVLATLLDFLIVAAVVFAVTKAFIGSSPPPPPSKSCPACREAIHLEATRCKFCTSEQPKASPAA